MAEMRHHPACDGCGLAQRPQLMSVISLPPVQVAENAQGKMISQPGRIGDRERDAAIGVSLVGEIHPLALRTRRDELGRVVLRAIADELGRFDYRLWLRRGC